MLDINEGPAVAEATEGNYPEEVILYKYIRIEHLESILRTGEIKATQLACANDPMECLPRFEDYHTFREWASEELRFPFVLCLSTKISSPTMWAHYTDGHNGVCLAIKLKTNPPHTNTIKRLQLPENLTIRQSQKGSLVKVIYDEWRSPYFDDSILDEKSQEYKLLIQWTMTKSTEWKYEQEYRYILK